MSDHAHPAAHLGRVAQRAFDRLACGERLVTTVARQAFFDDGLLARKLADGKTTYTVTRMARRRWEAWRQA